MNSYTNYAGEVGKLWRSYGKPVIGGTAYGLRDLIEGNDAGIVASGHTVFDFGMAKQISRRVEFNFSLDNLLNRDYYETQNYFESRVTPDAPIVARIHGTPGFPTTAVAGVTLRFGGK